METQQSEEVFERVTSTINDNCDVNDENVSQEEKKKKKKTRRKKKSKITGSGNG
jgi:Ser-tRNA(Ala) deacylase AlaX